MKTETTPESLTGVTRGSVPAGWEVRMIDGGLEISAPTTNKRFGGGITLYWKTRRYSLGYGCRPHANAPTYTGRGWQQRMIKDACAALDAALMPFRNAEPTRSGNRDQITENHRYEN